MWRIALDLFIGANAIAGLVGFGLRLRNKRRGSSHEEYQARLRRENEELERLRKEIGGGE
jgi:hypothetical protein